LDTEVISSRKYYRNLILIGNNMATNNAINADTNKFIGKINFVEITSSGTYTPSANLLYATIELVGGGGSGGAIPVTTGGASGSSGAGAGGYCKKTFTAAQIGANAAVTIGAGGAAAAAGGNDGNGGGITTFNPAGTGGTLTGNGGARGISMSTAVTSPSVVSAGVGGTATGGDVNITGQNGENGSASGVVPDVTTGGAGGGTILGYGSPTHTLTTGANGNVAPTGFGGGSGGAVGNNSGTATASQAGAPGVCMVTEYIAG
jgi:hypothetical protein